jgi:hypothetical protein
MLAHICAHMQLSSNCINLEDSKYLKHFLFTWKDEFHLWNHLIWCSYYWVAHVHIYVVLAPICAHVQHSSDCIKLDDYKDFNHFFLTEKVGFHLLSSNLMQLLMICTCAHICAKFLHTYVHMCNSVTNSYDRSFKKSKNFKSNLAINYCENLVTYHTETKELSHNQFFLF